jgi:hypothetical protein
LTSLEYLQCECQLVESIPTLHVSLNYRSQKGEKNHEQPNEQTVYNDG